MWSGGGLQGRARSSLRHGHQLEQVAVRRPEVDAAPTAPLIELAVVRAPRRAAVDEADLLHPAKDGVELRVGDVEGIGWLSSLVSSSKRKVKVSLTFTGAKCSPT